MVGFVLFTLVVSERVCIIKEKKGHHGQELVSCCGGIIIAGPHQSILGLGDLIT